MGRRPILFAALLSVALSAGCTGSNDPQSEPSTSNPLGPGAVQLDDAGRFVGHVVDGELLPITRAEIVMDEGAPLAADEAGEVVVTNVVPGSHRFLAQAVGYVSSARTVDVIAGETTELTFVLQRVPVDEPYVLVQIQKGVINCGVAAVVAAAVCGGNTTSPAFGPYRASLVYPIPAGHIRVIGETMWSSSSNAMSTWFTVGSASTFVGDAVGKPVLRKEFASGHFHRSLYNAPQNQYVAFPSSNQSFGLRIQSFYQGILREEINGTANPVCQPYQGYCGGVGVALEFVFTQYVTAFVNGLLVDTLGYSAVPEG